MISESPKTFRLLTFNSIAFFSPCTSASYSDVLLVHSNSNLHERKCLFFYGSIRTQRAPNPSNVLEPSKNKIQKSLTTECESIPTAKSTILQSISSACENWRRSG